MIDVLTETSLVKLSTLLFYLYKFNRKYAISKAHAYCLPMQPSSLFLKNTANEIAPMLTHLLQQSLTHDTLPSAWKHAYV